MRIVDPPLKLQTISKVRAGLVVLVLGALLGVIAALLTGISNIRSGAALLPGDEYQATNWFQIVATLVAMTTAGVFEEFGMRGFIQFRLARYWHPIFCEGTAGATFIALHFQRFEVSGQLLFVILLALVCGRAAATMKSVRWPILIHTTANLTVVAVAWIGRA
jgi:membrane protease YdiL (CAAX protease family)